MTGGAIPAARESGVDVLGDISPQDPGSPKELADQTGAGQVPYFPAGCSSLPPPQPHPCSPLSSCGTGLALPMARPPRPSHVEKPCSPTQSPSWPAWKVKGTGQSISGHSSALITLALGAKGRKGQFGNMPACPCRHEEGAGASEGPDCPKQEDGTCAGPGDGGGPEED